MPASRREVLDAVLSNEKSPENRLTELFATILSTHRGYARRLFDRVGIRLPEENVRFEVFTQRLVAPGCRPDMVVSAYVGNEIRGQLWSEHKTASDFRDLQLEDYLGALNELRARERVRQSDSFQASLISIVNNPSEEESEHWVALTWQDVAELANQGGFAWEGKRWREAAREPDAPAQQRLLHEFLWYLEQKGFAVTEPLNPEHVEALRLMADTTEAFEALLERAAHHMADKYESGERDWLELDGLAQLFAIPDDSWARRVQAAGWPAFLEMTVSGYDEWWVDSTGQPAAGAGLRLDAELYEVLSRERDWLAGLEGRELEFTSYGEVTLIYKTWPISQVVEAGETLDHQARALAQWALEVFDNVIANSPGDGWEPPVRPRRRAPKDSPGGDQHLCQRVSATDLKRGVIRIPQGETKGAFFPAHADDLSVMLRGQEVECRWDPRYGHGTAGGERSGVLRLETEVLDRLVDEGDTLELSSDQAGLVSLD